MASRLRAAFSKHERALAGFTFVGLERGADINSRKPITVH